MYLRSLSRPMSLLRLRDTGLNSCSPREDSAGSDKQAELPARILIVEGRLSGRQ